MNFLKINLNDAKVVDGPAISPHVVVYAVDDEITLRGRDQSIQAQSHSKRFLLISDNFGIFQ